MSVEDTMATAARPHAASVLAPETVSGRTSSFEAGSLLLDVRAAVAMRQFAERKQTLFYLCLFDDEIDSRLEAFQAFSTPAPWTEQLLAAAALNLEPTDAVVIACRRGEILVARGGASNFPLYWTTTAGKVLVSTVLPVDRGQPLSRAGLLSSVTVVAIANQNEPNLSVRTPLDGWFRCRRGAVSRLSSSAGCVSERLVDLAESGDTELDQEALIEALRSALDQFGHLQRGRRRALLELSGGFDSTIAAIAARRHGIELVGVSEHLPYYEFRFEEGIQRDVASSLAMSRVCLDGTAFFSFAPSDWWPKIDEPAIAVIRLKRALETARLALSEGLDRVFVGHGGDQLFAEDILDRDTPPYAFARGAFSKVAWPELEREQALIESSPFFLRRSCLTFSYDARFDAVLKEAYGTTTRSPFTDLACVRCGVAWSKLCARLGLPLGKSIMVDAFPELPASVTHRKGKVPWDGVTSRAYALHADHIATEIEHVRGPLERVGLDVSWLVRRVAQLADGKRTSSARDDKEVIASYALATWLRSWGVERVSDCSWND